jgi:hypothetical protein
MRGGRREHAPTEVKIIRDATAEQLASLPTHVTALAAADPPYPVSISNALQEHYERVRESVS